MSPRLTGLARLPGRILPWVHMRNFSPVSETSKGQRSWGRVLAPNSRNKANMAKYKIYNFRAYHSFGNSWSCISAVKWDAYDDENTARWIQDDAIRTTRIHPAFIPVTGLKCSSYGKISSPLNYWDPGWKNRDLGNRASHVNRASVKRSSVRENLRSLFTFLCRARTWSVPCTHVTLRLLVLTNSLPRSVFLFDLFHTLLTQLHTINKLILWG